MTTHTLAPTARAPPALGFGAALRAEWRKFWALRVNRTVLWATVAITVGMSVLIVLFSSGANLAKVQQNGKYDAIFFSALFGVWAIIYLGANFVASEFRSGMADYTFVATPKRARVLLAKVLIVGGLGFGTGLVISIIDVALTQGALALGGYPTLDLSDPGLIRAILLYVSFGMFFQGVLGCLLAVLVRNAFGALVIEILLTIVPVLLSKFLSHTYIATVPRWTPGALVENVSGVASPTEDGFLPTHLALLGSAVWIAILGIMAAVRITRSDAQ